MSYTNPHVEAMTDLIRESAPQMVADGLSLDSEIWRTIAKQRCGAKGPEGVLKYENNDSAIAFEPGDDLPSGQRAKFEKWTLPWSSFAAAMSFEDLGLRMAFAAGRDALIAYYNEQIVSLIEDLVDKIDNSAISGDGTGGTFPGITSKIISDTGTWAGINRAITPEWGCLVHDNSGTARTFSVALFDAFFKAFRMDIRKKKMDPRSFQIVMGPDTMSAVMGTTTGTVTTQIVKGASEVSEEAVNKAFGVVSGSYKKIPFVEVPNWTEGRLDLINMDKLKFHPMLAGNGVEGPSLMTPTIEAPFHFLAPQRSNSSYQWDVLVYLALSLFNPRKNAASLQDIDY